LNQYNNIINNEVGYEHYFLNYYLYLPYSKNQEEITIFEAIKYLYDMELLKNDDININLDNFFCELIDILTFIKKYSDKDIKEIEKDLNKENILIIENNNEEKAIISKEFKKFIKIEEEFNHNSLTNNSNNNKIEKEIIYYNENNKNKMISNFNLCKNIIYGDYKNKNELVEVFIHQRTMKKVKYKKREYHEIHNINKQQLDIIKKKIKDYLDNKFQIGIFINNNFLKKYYLFYFILF
jgi:hypothetical protein